MIDPLSPATMRLTMRLTTLLMKVRLPRRGLLMCALPLASLAACRSGGQHSPTVATAVSAAIAPLPAACGPAPRSMPASGVSVASTPPKDPLVTFDSAWTIIARTHWDTTYNGVNWRAVRDELRPKAAAAQTTGQLRAVLSDMVSRLNQSHFSIIPREVADASGSSTDGAKAPDRSGTVGAELRWIDSTVIVAQLDRGGPAEQAGVRAGWRLLAVNGCPISARLARAPVEADLRRAALTAYSIATQALAGPVGDTAAVLFADERGADRLVRIVRAPPQGVVAKFGNLPAMTAELSHERVRVQGKTVGIIRFNIWMPVLSPQFDAAIDSLRDVDAIVLDVRGNFGGVGGMSMGIAGHFLDSTRTIGTMVQRGATLKFVANPRRVDTRSRGVTPFAGPLAIVVDELSISTTEIFAGGLQALGRAQVFGVQTSGQALPSVPERLPNGDILYHAIADFLSPTGKQIEGDGVRPDHVVPMTRAARLAGRDPALDAALAWAVSVKPKQ